MKKANDEFEEALDRWFKFVEDYKKESTVPLSYVMLPNANQSYRTCGSPSGCLKLDKKNRYAIMLIGYADLMAIHGYKSGVIPLEESACARTS